MKKEKLEEISNEEYLDEDTKKMKKKFKLFNKFIIILEGLMLVPIGVALIMIILSTIICITNNNSNFFDVLFTEITSHEEGTPITIDDIIEVANKFSGYDMTKEDYLIELNINENEDYETTLKVFLILRIIFSVIDYIIVILIVDNIGKIFLSIQKDGTPFTESNLKCLNRINIFAAILCVFGLGRFAIGLLPLIIIFAITYIFRNGCKLQQQADETI